VSTPVDRSREIRDIDIDGSNTARRVVTGLGKVESAEFGVEHVSVLVDTQLVGETFSVGGIDQLEVGLVDE